MFARQGQGGTAPSPAELPRQPSLPQVQVRPAIQSEGSSSRRRRPPPAASLPRRGDAVARPCWGPFHPVLPDRGPRSSSGTPRLGEDPPVPHLAPPHTLTVATPCPSALPVPPGTVLGARGSWEGLRQESGEAQGRAGPATTRATSCVSAGAPQPPWGAALHPSTSSPLQPPAANHSPSPSRWDTPSASGRGCWGQAAGAGALEQGGCPQCLAGWGRREDGTLRALPIPQPSPGQDGAPCTQGCPYPSSSL